MSESVYMFGDLIKKSLRILINHYKLPNILYTVCKQTVQCTQTVQTDCTQQGIF